MNSLKLTFGIWVGKKDPFFEAIVLNCNRYDDYFANKAVEYCRKVLHAPWPKAEKLIARSSMAAYNYSRHILKKRWVKGEKAISNSSEASYLYAKFVLKGRFKAGEKEMAGWHRTAYLYAKNVLKSRFDAAENIVAKSPYAALYASQVMKKRWKKAEEEIMHHSHVTEFNNYIEILRGKDRIDFYNKVLALGLSLDPNLKPWNIPVAKKWLETFGGNFVREK